MSARQRRAIAPGVWRRATFVAIAFHKELTFFLMLAFFFVRNMSVSRLGGGDEVLNTVEIKPTVEK